MQDRHRRPVGHRGHTLAHRCHREREAGCRLPRELRRIRKVWQDMGDIIGGHRVHDLRERHRPRGGHPLLHPVHGQGVQHNRGLLCIGVFATPGAERLLGDEGLREELLRRSQDRAPRQGHRRPRGVTRLGGDRFHQHLDGRTHGPRQGVQAHGHQGGRCRHGDVGPCQGEEPFNLRRIQQIPGVRMQAHAPFRQHRLVQVPQEIG